MHGYEWQESLHTGQLGTQVRQHLLGNVLAFSVLRHFASLLSARPSTAALSGHPVEVHHGGVEETAILLELSDQFVPERGPGWDASSLPSFPCTPHDAGTDTREALHPKIWRKQPLDEFLLRLSFHVNEQAHRNPTGTASNRPTPKMVLLPELAKAEVLKPRFELRGF